MCPIGRTLAAAALATLTVGAGSTPPPAAAHPASPRIIPATPVTPAPGSVQAGSRIATASLGGTITSAAGKPLARARVTISAAALPAPRVAITGPDGKYQFANLPEGTYSVSVARSGYVPQRFGERRAAPSTTVALTVGQAITGIDVALNPAGVIVGRVFDEDGTPFSGARVEALASRAENGQAALVAAATAATDDKGNFRLIGLGEGHYYVAASDPAFETVGDETGPLTYTRTYYPGVVFAEEARRVAVTPGVEPANPIVFTLQIVRPARVLGMLTTVDRRQLISGAVIMRPLSAEALSAVPTRDVVIQPDGSFSFRNIPPGRYQIRARGEVERNGVSLFATFNVSVAGQDIRNVAMTLAPGASMEGTVIFETTRAPKRGAYAGLRVRAPFADGSTFGDALTGEVQPDGSFRIRGLMSGGHHITVDGLQYPWTVKSVTYRGQEIADSGIDVESRQEFKDVRITVTDAAAEVAGVVRDARGRAAADAVVLFIPAAPQFWTRTSRRFGLLRTDAGGRYRLRGLPSGEYHAIATFDVNETEAFRREILQDLLRLAQPVTIRDKEQRTIDLPLVSLVEARRTVSR